MKTRWKGGMGEHGERRIHRAEGGRVDEPAGWSEAAAAARTALDLTWIFQKFENLGPFNEISPHDSRERCGSQGRGLTSQSPEAQTVPSLRPCARRGRRRVEAVGMAVKSR
eukprot:6187965-Pleurochrysis_carterae.AAC.1